MTHAQSPVTTVQECEHVALWTVAPPKRGSRVYCPRCADMRSVLGAIGDWHAVCRDCRFARVYVTPEACSRNVRAHIDTHPDHVVDVGQLGDDRTVAVRASQDSDPQGLW